MQEEIKIIVLNSEGLQQFAHLIPDKLKDTASKSDSIVLGALGPEKVTMGVAIFSEHAHYMELEWIYVEPEFRRIGIGSALLKRMIDSIEDSSYYIGVCADYIHEDTPGLDYLLEILGFAKEEQDWGIYRFQLKDAFGLEKYVGQKNETRLKGLCSISDCTQVMKKNFSFNLNKEEEAYPIGLPIQWDNYDAELSCAYLEKGEISAVFLLETDENRINISFAFAKDKPYVFPYMLVYSFNKAINKYKGSNPEITVTTLDEAAEKLLLKLIPGVKNIDVTHAQKNTNA